MARNKRISGNMAELSRILENVPQERKAIADSLYNELVFMQDTLVKLRQQITDEGAITLFKQGKQEFLTEHPALKAYNTTIQRYSLLYKQLTDLLPQAVKKPQADPVVDFIKAAVK